MIIFCIILSGFIYEDADSLIVNNDSFLICGLHQYNVKVNLINNARITVRSWNGSDSSGWLQFKVLYIYNAEGRVVERITLNKKKKIDLRCLKPYFIKPRSVNAVCAKVVVIR